MLVGYSLAIYGVLSVFKISFMKINMAVLTNIDFLCTFAIHMLLIIISIVLCLGFLLMGAYSLVFIVLCFLAKNPLILVECKISSKNDILMILSLLGEIVTLIAFLCSLYSLTCLYFFYDIILINMYYYTDSFFLHMDPTGGGGAQGPGNGGGGVPNNQPNLPGGNNPIVVPNPDAARPDHHVENIYNVHGFTNGHDRNIRDSVIANGYDPAVSNQPYASLLVEKITSIRAANPNQGLQPPLELNSPDKRYLDTLHRYYRNNVTHQGFDANRHYPCANAVLNYIKRLP